MRLDATYKESRMIQALRRILDAVSSKTNFDEALQVLAALVKEALAVDVASVFLLDEELKTYILMASDGLNADAIGVARLELDQGLVGLVGQREEPINLAVANSHP